MIDMGKLDADRKSQILQIAAIALIVALIGWCLYGGSIKRYFVLGDLRYYATTIRRSEISTGCKEELLGLVHDVQDHVRDGNSPQGWGETDEAIRELLGDGIDCEEAKLIRLELDRVLRNLSEDG
jgi:hypothetical protein